MVRKAMEKINTASNCDKRHLEDYLESIISNRIPTIHTLLWAMSLSLLAMSL